MSVSRNNKTTADAYTDALTLYQRGSVRVQISSTNASVIYQLGFGDTPSSVVWDAEVFSFPQTHNLERRFDAVRVRSATAGTPAQVTLVAMTPADLP